MYDSASEAIPIDGFDSLEGRESIQPMEKTVPLVSKNWNLFCVFALSFHFLSIDSHAQAPPHALRSLGSTPPTSGTTAGPGSFSYTLPAIDFGQVWIQPGQIQFRTYTVTLLTRETLDVDIEDESQTGVANDWSNYNYEIDDACYDADDGAKCQIVFGFVPTHTDAGSVTATITIKHDPPASPTTITVGLTGTGTAQPPTTSGSACTTPEHWLFPVTRSPGALVEKVARDFGIYPGDALRNTKEAAINCFYSTDSALAFFTQIGSVYSRASGSSTVSATIGSFNFSNGMQLSLGTNIQAGSTGTSAATSSGGTPTLSAASAGQAAQNLFYGGNFYLYALYPIVSKKNWEWDRVHFEADGALREGVDLQNFSGTSATANSPTTHFDAFGEAYVQYDAIPVSGSTTVPLALFAGGQIGGAYTSHTYAREYGFGNTWARVASISAGLVVTGQFNIAIQREFGPSQTYIDSTTMNPTTVNNFKSWSFAIQYQSKGVSSSK